MPYTRKEHSNDFRGLAIKHSLTYDSEPEVAGDMFCSRSTIHPMITKYKKQCIANLVVGS